MRKLIRIFASAALIVAIVAVPGAQQQSGAPGATGQPARPLVLAPTAHPAIPIDSSQFWLAPDRSLRPLADIAIGNAVGLVGSGEYTKALEILSQPANRQGLLGQYALHYSGVAQLRLTRAAQARSAFQAVQGQKPVGYLAEAAALGEAEADEALNNQAAAVGVYERLLTAQTISPEDALMRLGRAARAAGEIEKAVSAYSRVYYEFALSEVAPMAGSELIALTGGTSARGDRFKRDLARAERFFTARQYPAARGAFESLRSLASGADRDLIDLRLAECDHFLKHPLRTRDGLKRFVDEGPYQAEAMHFYALALRDLGERDESARIVRRIVDEFPTAPWAEEALNALAGHYVVKSDDDLADDLFRELCEKYPRSRYSERAAWKVGWRAYRDGSYAEAARFFEQGASSFPRSDYRPAWLYWAGRAHDQLNETSLAQERYALVASDYRNTYYGRLGQPHLDAPASATVRVIRGTVTLGPAGTATATGGQDVNLPPALPPNASLIKALLSVELYDDALNELRYAQKVWGDSPPIQATMAWTYRQQARSETGSRRFQLLRSAVNGMRRAYPQFLAAGGENLPRDLLAVIYPLGYWDLIRRYAAEYELDPYFVAALVGQESTFVAEIRSKASAVGLMQLMPATARTYARKLGLRYSPQLLTEPEANIRMGTAYLADKIKEFGEPHLALASYNAGERVVRRWVDSRGDLSRDEFIDDIPYPETQNYVKRVLGTADDYRHLYAEDKAELEGVDAIVVKASTAASSSKTKASTATSPTKRPAPAKRSTKPRKSA